VVVFVADYVVVSSGRHDLGRSDYEAAVRAYFRDVRRAYPKAKVAVLAPFWVDENPPEDLIDARLTVQEAAAAAGATYVSTQGWLSAANLGPDGVHLSASGQEAVARRLATALAGWKAPTTK
jgi:lysophospholipase L1-like esterase